MFYNLPELFQVNKIIDRQRRGQHRVDLVIVRCKSCVARLDLGLHGLLVKPLCLPLCLLLRRADSPAGLRLCPFSLLGCLHRLTLRSSLRPLGLFRVL